MDFDNTIQAMQSMGFQVVKQGKRILRKKKKRTKSAGLEKGFNYNVNKSKTGVELEFVFGKAKKYWQFVDEGVRGKGGFKGSGRARGKGSPFKFKYESPGGDLVKAIKKWIKNKPLRLRGSDGKFKSKTAQNINSSAWAIGYGIKRRGLERTQFFSKPYKKEVEDNIDVIGEAFGKDLENELEIMLEDIDIEITVKGK